MFAPAQTRKGRSRYPLASSHPVQYRVAAVPGPNLTRNHAVAPDDSPLGAAAVDRAESNIEPGIH